MKHRLTRWAAGMLAIAFVGIHPALAQDSTRTITLKEAIDLSISNSHLLKNNRARINEATAAVLEANERKLPDFSVSGSYLYLPVQPGIRLKTDSAGKGGSSPKVSQALYGMASISIPVFTAGKLKYGIESARYLEQAARLDAEDNQEAVILNTINAFSNLYKSAATVRLVQENLEQSRERVKVFSNLEKNGLLARNDLLKASLQASNVELALLDAQSNHKLASVNMALMLGLPEQTLLLTDSTSLGQAADLKSIDEYETTALQERKDAGALALRRKVADVNIKSIRADYFPTLGLTAGYIAADIPGFLTISNAINVGVGVKYNLSALWKTKSRLAQAQARVEQISANQQSLVDEIRMQVNTAYQNYLLSQKKIEVYKQAVEQAEENYRITKNKYDNALANTTDLLEADVDQLQARLNLSNAAADAVVAYNKLLQTAGVLHNN